MRSILCSLVSAMLLSGAATAALAQGFDPGLADFDHDDFVSASEAKSFAAGAWEEISGGAAKVNKAAIGQSSPMLKGLIAEMPADATGDISRDVFIAAMDGRFEAAAPGADGLLPVAMFARAIGMQPL